MKLSLINSQEKNDYAVEKKVLSAVKKYRDFIAPTYGPAGKKTLISVNDFNVEAVDDGKRTTEAFELEDELENAVIQYIKNVIKKCKDGNTTAGLIMSSIVIEAFKDIEDEWVSHDYHGSFLSVKKGIQEACEQITKLSKKIETRGDLYTIAYNSYNNEKVASLIADTVFKIGKDGVLSIEDSSSTETEVEIVNGLEIHRGYHSPYFINEEGEKVVLENPSILLINKKIELFSELIPVVTFVEEGQRKFISQSMVIIADGFAEDVTKGFIVSKVTGRIKPLLVETPGFGGDKLENLLDIASVVGAKVVDNKLLKLEDVKREDFGTCDTVKSLKDKTIFLGGAKQTKDRIAKIKDQIDSTESVFEKEKLKKRIASLLDGVAVIKVGAYTENEQKGMKVKIENAVNSTQMAFKGGIVRGAGKAFSDITTSSEILNKALCAPRDQLEKNGLKYLDEETSDPLEVVITALQSGGSIAGELLEIGGISAVKREKVKEENNTD